MIKPTEEHLNLALQILSKLEIKEQESGRFEKAAVLSYQTVINYIVADYFDKNPHLDEITKKEIDEKLRLMITQTILNDLVDKGLLEAELDDECNEIFRITDLGKMVTQQLKDEQK